MFPLLLALTWSDPGDTGFTSELIGVPVQGSLTDGSGVPVHGTREVTINLYDAGDTLRASHVAPVGFFHAAFAAALDVDTEILLLQPSGRGRDTLVQVPRFARDPNLLRFLNRNRR